MSICGIHRKFLGTIPISTKKRQNNSSQLEIEPGINCWIEGRLTTAPTSISVRRLTTGGTNCFEELFSRCNITPPQFLNLGIKKHTHTHTHTRMSLADLPLDVLHIIAKFMRTPAAECVVDGRMCVVSRRIEPAPEWSWVEDYYVNPSSRLMARRGDHYHLSRRLMDQARDRAYNFPKMTPRKEAEWLRGQLALNHIHLPPNTRRKTMWRVFLSL
jgi:hypothetical protein